MPDRMPYRTNFNRKKAEKEQEHHKIQKVRLENGTEVRKQDACQH